MSSDDFFRKQGRSLLANGYLIVPIKPGKKAPVNAAWQMSRMGAEELPRYPGHGVGVMTGQGAYPICAIDVDALCDQLAQRFTQWCLENLGVTCLRQGLAPKVLLVYRAENPGWGKASSAVFEDWFGDKQQLEILGNGQQFVAYHIHPDTRQPYAWLDDQGGIENVRADMLPVISEEQVCEAVRTFERMAEELGYKRKSAGQGSVVVEAPKEREPRSDEDFFGRVNEAAMQGMDQWVPVLFPSARQTREGGWRVESVDLGRANEEALSLHPSGIKDWGVYDMGDAREGRRTPIDVVLEWWGGLEITSPFEAATWLCEQLGKSREEMGFGLRRARDREAATSAKRAALQGVRDQISSAEDSISLLENVAPIARGVIEQHHDLHSEIEGLFKAKFKELTGTGMTASDARNRLSPVRVQTVAQEAHPLTEFGNAKRLIDRYGAGLMFVPELDKWFAWSDCFWERKNAVHLEHLTKETITAMGGESANYGMDSASFFAFCMKSQSQYMVKSTVHLARSDPRVVVPAKELDKHTHLLGVKNGVVDLTTGQLMKADPEYRITRTAGAAYNPYAKAPWFLQTLREAMFDDEEMVRFVQVLVGYALLGDPREDILVIPHGGGANGKSAIFENGIAKAFGDYAMKAAANTFVSDGKTGGGSAGSAREDLVRLRGSRFVYVGETADTDVLREADVKSMSGGDKIVARVPYGPESVEFYPSWVAFMPTNHLPIVRNDDHGIWRRIVAIPFVRKFDSDTQIKKDPLRKVKINGETEGVLAWCIQGALIYQKEGIVYPEKVRAAKEEYRDKMDILSEWLNHYCDIGPEYEELASKLWEKWQEFSNKFGHTRFIGSSIALGRKLDPRFPRRKDTYGQIRRVGLRLKTETPTF